MHTSLQPIDALQGTRAYKVPRSSTPVDLRLDGNEGVALPDELLSVLSTLSPETLRAYPKPHELDRALADKLGLPVEQVLATAGADDALDRTCRAMLCAGRSSLLTTPTFEMIARYATLTGAHVQAIDWPDSEAFPVSDFLTHITPDTRHIALVSPNNPTGQVISRQALHAIATAAPHALVLVDHAYVEFADDEHDLSIPARDYPNVVVARTLSKAWGIAGLRVGYITGPARVISWLRASGNPYALTGPSIALAIERLNLPDQDIQDYIALSRRARHDFAGQLALIGARPTPSQANFCFARHHDTPWLRDVLASLGIAARIWPDHPTLGDALRMSCPHHTAAAARVTQAIATIAPEAILFDMDGVLVDVSASYRQAIIQTARHFGAVITPEEIQSAKHRGDANNDWLLTQELLATHDIHATLEEVTRVFEDLYQGTPSLPGLKQAERACVTRAQLEACAALTTLGIVTGRPRRDAMEFLEREGLQDLFEVVICMEDAPAKPSAQPVALAMHKLRATTAWMLGDTPDDVRSARRATEAHDGLYVAPFGVLPPGESSPEETSRALVHAGAGRTFAHTSEFIDKILAITHEAPQ